MTERSVRRGLLVLLASAALLFTANANRLSLLPLDDCHYAQKGVEMFERGAFFSVTWAGEANTQHPPFQFWLMSRSFALFGVNDFAARLPSILMALGILLTTFAIGRRTVGAGPALAGVALLLITNTFLQNARRTMLEIPTAFWVGLIFWAYLKGREAPRWFLALAVPLAAAILTKSVVGLMPLVVLVAAQALPQLRVPRGWAWLALGVGLGLLGGASWTLHQGLTLGWESMDRHYFGEVGRAVADSSPWDYLIAYPRIVVERFQPVAIPGLIGAVWVWRRGASTEWPLGRVLSLWILVWLVAASASSARISRYVWPILVPLSLLSGWMLTRWSRRLATVVSRWLVPAVAVVAAVVFWISPQTLTRDLDAPFKDAGPRLRTLLPAYTQVPVLGTPSWRLTSPLLYYGQLVADPVTEDITDAVSAARSLPSPLMIVARDRRGDLVEAGWNVETRESLVDWELVELRPGAPTPTGKVTPSPGGG